MKAIKILLVSLLTINLVSCNKDEVLEPADVVKELPIAESNSFYVDTEEGYYQNIMTHKIYELLKEDGAIIIVGHTTYVKLTYNNGKYTSLTDELRLNSNGNLLLDLTYSDLELKKL